MRQESKGNSSSPTWTELQIIFRKELSNRDFRLQTCGLIGLLTILSRCGLDQSTQTTSTDLLHFLLTSCQESEVIFFPN